MFSKVVAIALLAFVLISMDGSLSGADALPCRCFLGRASVTSPQCVCTCNAGYMSPTCMFRASDEVRVFLYVNRSLSEFVTDYILSSVTQYALTSTTLMYSVRNISNWNYVEAVVIVDGFAVDRLLTAVRSQDPWVVEQGIMSAYVVEPRLPGEGNYDIVLYENGKLVITAYAISWLLSALFVLFILGCCEGCCCLTNMEENNEHLRGFKGGDDSVEEPKEQEPAEKARRDAAKERVAKRKEKRSKDYEEMES